MRRLPFVLASTLTVLASAAGAGAVATKQTPVTETAVQGNVRATLSYVKVVESSGFTSYRNLRLTITRDGQVVNSTPPPHSGTLDFQWPANAWRKNAKSVHVEDLDGDGEPEVVLDLYSGGAHCCHALYAYRWTGTLYAAQQMQTGSSGYDQRDLDGDGKPEWVTADPRFEYLFTSFAGSGVPVRIYDFQQGNFVVVTTKYPSLIRTDAARWWRFYRHHLPSQGPDVRGLLAAWAADMCLLGQSAKVWPALNTAYRQGKLNGTGPPRGLAFIAALRQKLRAFGYLR